MPAAASAKNSRSPVTTPALIASAGRIPSVMARATMAVTAGPGVSAATAIVADRARYTPGVICEWRGGGDGPDYSQPLRRK